MTFFNVVSAILFLGALQQLIFALDAEHLHRIIMSVTLAVLVFNDAVYTSHTVEGEKSVEYKLDLMLVDLVNFLLLACAILAVNPAHNVFEVDLKNIGPYIQEWHFWLIVTVYWLLVKTWSYLAGVYKPPYPPGLLISSFVLAGLFGAQTIIATDGRFSIIGGIVAASYLVLHIAVMRPLMYWLSRRKPRPKPATHPRPRKKKMAEGS
jgi:hypothetical protein